MKLKKVLFLLCSVAVMVTIGSFLKIEWQRYQRIQAAFPPDVKQVLEKSEKFYLYSLQDEKLPPTDLRTMPNFHGYPILGQTRVRPTPQRSDLLAALREGLGNRDDCVCLNPHYGVRVVRGNKTVDLVIGFTCEQMEVYDERGVHRISVSATTQSAFNHMLAEFDVPLPTP